jgi:hypothetical protein
MVDIDACNLILDRPWQYKVEATHFGMVNLFKINKDGMNYMLVILKENMDAFCF